MLVDELRYTLVVGWEATEDLPRNLDYSNLLHLEDMVAMCAGLVVIEHESQAIRLVYFTTQDFFRNSLRALFPMLILKFLRLVLPISRLIYSMGVLARPMMSLRLAYSYSPFSTTPLVAGWITCVESLNKISKEWLLIYSTTLPTY